jgi:ribonuclease HI
VLNVDDSCLGDPRRVGLVVYIDMEMVNRLVVSVAIWVNNTFLELMVLYHGLKISREAGYHGRTYLMGCVGTRPTMPWGTIIYDTLYNGVNA